MDNVSPVVSMVLLGLVLLSQVVLWSVLYQVVKQQGRILLRLDELARSRPPELPVIGSHAAAAAPVGPKVGHSVEGFRLPNLAGEEVRLEDYRGKRVLLVNWSPKCGFCELIAPDLAKYQARLLDQGVNLVLVSRGDAVSNLQLAQAHDLNCPILLQPDSESLDVFRHQGTPVACLVDEEGKVARSLAVGASEVPPLVEELAKPTMPEGKHRLPGEKPLSESRIVRDGLKAGTAAPTFNLPSVDGGEVALEQYRGKRVLLVLSDPHCGPCDALAPQLVHLQPECEKAGLHLVMVSRGELQETRQKVRQHGIAFPVCVQQRWEVSRAYGIFATPVAFLIDENGVIERDVVQGIDPIVALIHEQVEARKEFYQANGLVIR